MSSIITIRQAGRLDYAQAWEQQRLIAQQRSAGTLPDTLLVLEHPHTYTLGRTTRQEHVLITQTELEAEGIACYAIDRGGDITYHGPGQIVVYPILKLSHYGADVLGYLRMLEEVIIVALMGYGIHGVREPGLTGVWVGQEKIAAIGVKLSASGVTMHGFALNVNPDLRYFQRIVPCGIADRTVTSMAQLLGKAPAQPEVEQRLIEAFMQIFMVH